MRILVVGGSGFLGRKIVDIFNKCFRGHLEVYSTYYNQSRFKYHPNYYYLDALSKDNVRKLLSKINPDVVIHLVGIPNPDVCEMNKELAYNVNVGSTKTIVEECLKRKIKIVYTSTNYVFDGINSPYKENDKPNPLNWYGKTKLMGEDIVRSLLQNNHIIVRLPLLYGYCGYDTNNFLLKVIKSLKANNTLIVNNRSIRYPTLIDDVAIIIGRLIEKRCVGTYHVSSLEGITKYKFALRIAKTFNLPCDLLREENVFSLAKRPLEAKLNITKILGILKVKMHNIDQGLKMVKEQMVL